MIPHPSFRIIAKFLRTGLVICSHSREGETLSYNRINTVNYIQTQVWLQQAFCSFFISQQKPYHNYDNQIIQINFSLLLTAFDGFSEFFLRSIEIIDVSGMMFLVVQLHYLR